jgi:hypothetical protein
MAMATLRHVVISALAKSTACARFGRLLTTNDDILRVVLEGKMVADSTD